MHKRFTLAAAICGVVALVLAACTATDSAEQDDWAPKLEEYLAFAEGHGAALEITERCSASYGRAFYGYGRSHSEPFLDNVAEWARAKRRGHYGLISADRLHGVILATIRQARRVQSLIQDIPPDELGAFSREYVEACRAAGIRALADQ